MSTERRWLFFRRGQPTQLAASTAAVMALARDVSSVSEARTSLTTSATLTTPQSTTTLAPAASSSAPAAPSLASGKFSLTQPLKRSLLINGAGTATIFQGRQRTWKEVGDRVARLAGALRRLGVRSNERVAVLAFNSDRFLECNYAIPWVGAAIVPLNIRWAVHEHIYSLNDCEATVLVVDDAFAKLVPQIRAEVSTIKAVIFAGDGATPEGMMSYEEIVAEAEPIADAQRGNDDLAGIFYTGGTTGFPKGVMLSHLALFSNGLAFIHEANYSDETVYLHTAPMFHLADYAGSTAASISGAAHVFIPTFDPAKMIATIAEHGVTHTLIVPSMINMMAAHPTIDTTDLSCLRYLIYGASPISETLLSTAMAKLPTCLFIQAYGQTELSPIATILPASYHTFSGNKAGKLRSAGRPTYGVEVKITDPDGRELPRGSVGEVTVRGPNTMLGYWKKPAETTQALVDGWVRTGDGGYMDDDGFVFIVDRLKDMIITGGENVYSVEVENALSSHPAVASCAVIGAPSEQWGEAVHGVVVLKPGAQATGDELIAHCRGLIASYKCPRSISFQESLPISGAGKILKRELRAPYWQAANRSVN